MRGWTPSAPPPVSAPPITCSVCVVVCVQRTLTSTHTHPFTLTHTPVNYQDELKAKFLHRQMRPVECVKRVLLCTSWAGEMQTDPSPSASSEEPQGVGLWLAYYLLITLCCLLFPPVARFAPAITSSHLGAHRFCWFHFRNAQPTCFPE